MNKPKPRLIDNPSSFGRKGKNKSPWRGGHLDTVNTRKLQKEWEAKRDRVR